MSHATHEDCCRSVDEIAEQAAASTTERGNYCSKCGKQYGPERNWTLCDCGYSTVLTDTDRYEAMPKPWW